LVGAKKLFGDRVRELRRDRGFSQEAFADECGLHRTYMSGIERGLRNVSLENIARIANALGVPIGDLFIWSKAPDATGRSSRRGMRTTKRPSTAGRPR
jgi:transcriptional regulator with XRE-family HTH domain